MVEKILPWGEAGGSIDEFFDIFLLSDTLVLILNNDVNFPQFYLNFVLYDDNLIEVHNLYFMYSTAAKCSLV